MLNKLQSYILHYHKSDLYLTYFVRYMKLFTVMILNMYEAKVIIAKHTTTNYS